MELKCDGFSATVAFGTSPPGEILMDFPTILAFFCSAVMKRKGRSSQMITGRLSLHWPFGLPHRIEPNASHAGGQWFKSTTAHQAQTRPLRRRPHLLTDLGTSPKPCGGPERRPELPLMVEFWYPAGVRVSTYSEAQGHRFLSSACQQGGCYD